MAGEASTNVVSVRIAAELRRAILSGEMSPGERIRQEDLAGRYGASRIPVREALRMLVTDGLVTMVANSGAWVSSLTREESDEQYLIRERLEPLLLGLSLPHLLDEDIAELERLLVALRECTSTEEFMRLDRDFHHATYARATTSTLGDFIDRLWNTTQPYRRVFMNLVGHQGLEVANLEHQLLLEAIKRRDRDEAERILAGHIRRTRLELDRHPEVFEHPFGT